MSSNNDETKYYQEWKGFLQQTTRLDVRLAAITAVLEHPQTVPDDLWSEGVLPLVHFVDEEDDDDTTTVLLHNQITFKALQSLQYKIETSVLQHPEWVNRLWTRLTDLALSTPPRRQTSQQPMWRQCVNATCALLANLSRDEAGAIALVGTTLPEQAVYRHYPAEELGKDETVARVKPTMELLLSRFLSLQYWDGKMTTSIVNNNNNIDDDDLSKNENAADPYQHMAHVWMNITQVDLGRRFLLQLHHSKDHTTSTTSVLQQLLPQLQSPNAIRRCGIAGLCRNICLAESDSVDWLLHTCKIVTPLLWPLAGPEELDIDEKQGLDPQLWLLTGPDKQREPVAQIRLYLVEAILALLKQSRAARHVLRLQRVYVILKYADMVEEDELVSEQIYECVNYLRGDEEGLGKKEAAEAAAVVLQHVDYDQVD